MRRLTTTAAVLALLLGSAWAVLALKLTGVDAQGTPGMRYVLMAGLLGATAAAWRWRSLRAALAVVALGCAAIVAWIQTVTPRLDRDWSPDLARAARAEVNGPLVTIRDVRNFHYRGTADWDEAWYDATYDTRQLSRAWFIVEPFSGFEGAAHTMVSFGFDDGRFVTFSVEVRRQKGESFSVEGGLFRQFELLYVVGDERDLVQLRSNHRKDTVYLHPVRASRERIVAFFTDMVERMNALQARPEFYNSFTNNCTTNLVRHFEKVAAMDVPYDRRTLLPAYSDELAYELGLIDTSVSLAEAREHHRINTRALAAQDRDDFSLRIREPVATAP
ncbi:DUF4105 domain-containing protein [Myxococcaceae bacterium GXIMD 01537]